MSANLQKSVDNSKESRIYVQFTPLLVGVATASSDTAAPRASMHSSIPRRRGVRQIMRVTVFQRNDDHAP